MKILCIIAVAPLVGAWIEICTISSENPEDIRISRYPQGTDGKKLYKENREQCRADYAAFEDAAYALQDGMLAAE